ncbi:MAG: replicative DNA helicase [Aeromonadales bacterium]|nr:replicative DNA helicase [Aeromonadales bacterium]MDY2890637.1 replicative DNA helicase [Succinivibrio sp.]
MPSQDRGQDQARIRIVPANDDAERRFLGAIMLDGSSLERVTREIGLLKEEAFFGKRNRLVYHAILERAESSSNFDPTIISAWLESNGHLEEAGGNGYLSSLMNSGADPGSAPEYARIISECYKRRQIIALAGEVTQSAYEPDGREADMLFNEAQSKFYDAAEANRGEDAGRPRPMIEVTGAVIERIRENMHSGSRMRGVASGFRELDELTLGLQGGTLNIIAARPGVGKTSFAMNIVENIVLNPEVKKPGLVFSLEMPSESIALRMLSNFGQVPMQNLVNGEVPVSGWDRIMGKMRLLSVEREDHKGTFDKLFIDDSGSVTPAELRARAREIAEINGGLSVIMVDYLQLMKGDSDSAENRALELGSISRSLKLLSKELDVPVLALSQLNREVESRKDHRPMNSDLRESGSLEQDADLIMFLHREALYHERTDESADDGRALLIVSKNRNGALKDIDLQFIGEYTSFYDKEQPVGEMPPPPDDPQ